MHLAETWLERMHPQSLTFLPVLTFSHKSSNSLNAPGVQTPIRRNIYSHTRLAAAVDHDGSKVNGGRSSNISNFSECKLSWTKW